MPWNASELICIQLACKIFASFLVEADETVKKKAQHGRHRETNLKYDCEISPHKMKRCQQLPPMMQPLATEKCRGNDGVQSKDAFEVVQHACPPDRSYSSQQKLKAKHTSKAMLSFSSVSQLLSYLPVRG